MDPPGTESSLYWTITVSPPPPDRAEPWWRGTSGPGEVWAAGNGVSAVSCLDLISRRGKTLLDPFLCEKDGTQHSRAQLGMAASHTAKVSICSNCLGGKWSCVSISLISRDIRWHHRIFHSRECGAGPEFVPAVISSGQSCSHKYHSFGSYSPDWSAIGTVEAGLGWAGLGWAGLGWAGMWKSSKSSSSAILVRAARGDEFIILCWHRVFWCILIRNPSAGGRNTICPSITETRQPGGLMVCIGHTTTSLHTSCQHTHTHLHTIYTHLHTIYLHLHTTANVTQHNTAHDKGHWFYTFYKPMHHSLLTRCLIIGHLYTDNTQPPT